MILHLHLKRFITLTGLGVSLAAASSIALAQENVAPTINADGAVNADGPTLVYGDVNSPPGNTVIAPPKEISAPVSSDVVYAPPPGTVGDISATNGDAAALGPGDASAAPGTVNGGSGTALLGPDGTYRVSEVSPSDITVGGSGEWAPAPEPVSEPAPEAVEGAAEVDSGPLDSDGDGVADDDEVNIYGTDPWLWDTDGDGLSDSEELFNLGTDPLVSDGDGSAVADTVADTGDASAAGTDLAVTDEATSEASVVDSDNDRLADADEAAFGTDPSTPDADGDGYYDGDEVNLGTDPLDPASFPTEEQSTSAV